MRFRGNRGHYPCGTGHDALVPTVRSAAPSGFSGFTAAVAVNATVAIAFWVAVTNKYGYHDGNDISMHYEEWVHPTALFLALAVVAGLFSLAIRGWGRFGVGLIAGAAAVVILDIAWTFIYLLSTQG